MNVWLMPIMNVQSPNEVHSLFLLYQEENYNFIVSTRLLKSVTTI